MNDILPPESARWEWLEDQGPRADGALRLRQRAHADRRADGAVRARPRRGHRHRREGDVLLRRRDERRPPDAAPRGHRRHRARDGRAQRRSTTGRCASGRIGPMFRHERPQKGRYRQFHQFDVEALGCRAGRRRRADPDAARAAGASSASSTATCGWSSTASASPTSARRIAPRWSRTSRRMPIGSTRTRSAACTATRCASSTARTRRCRPSSRPRRS